MSWCCRVLSPGWPMIALVYFETLETRNRESHPRTYIPLVLGSWSSLLSLNRTPDCCDYGCCCEIRSRMVSSSSSSSSLSLTSLWSLMVSWYHCGSRSRLPRCPRPSDSSLFRYLCRSGKCLSSFWFYVEIRIIIVKSRLREFSHWGKLLFSQDKFFLHWSFYKCPNTYEWDAAI